VATGEGPVEVTRLEWHYLELQEFVRSEENRVGIRHKLL
jgi:hypothetical protein